MRPPDWFQDAQGLRVEVPVSPSDGYPVVLKIGGALWPKVVGEGRTSAILV